MVYKQVFPDDGDTVFSRKDDPKLRQNCLDKCINWCFFGNLEPKVVWDGAICKEKPNNKWTTDVYLDFLVLSGEGVPRQVMHVQGESLRDLLKGKKKHHRQLRLQTSFLAKHLRQQMEANSLEILRAGIDTGNGPWPRQRTSEGMSGKVCGILELRTVLQLHQQRCNICENDIQALQAILKQNKGAARGMPCIRKVFITPEVYNKMHAKLKRWLPADDADP